MSAKPWLLMISAVLGAAITGAALGLASRQRRALAGVREQVPEAHLKIIDRELDDAEARARAAGAQGELEYKGAGATGIVLCDQAGKAFKVARGAGELDEDAAWLRKAVQMPSTGRNIMRLDRYDAKNRVLVGECVQGKIGGWKDERKLFELHQRIRAEMRQYGWNAPEFKADSYVIARGRGPVLVDASAAGRRGHALVADVLDVINGRRQLRKYERLQDLAWDVKMERGESIQPAIADKLIARLQDRFPDQ